MKHKDKVIKAIILAGGYSRRMGLEVPKQLAKIGTKPTLAYTLEVFERSKLIDGIILVSHKKFIAQCRALIKQYKLKKVERLVAGGKSRQRSVSNALAVIRNCKYVIIHDGVRPLVTQEIIARVVKAVQKFGAVTSAVRATDTIVKAKDGAVDTVLSRDRLWRVQTPQAFKFTLILQAHRRQKATKTFNASDDAQLVLQFNKKVKIVKGSYQNIKITTPLDLDLIKTLLRNRR